MISLPLWGFCPRRGNRHTSSIHGVYCDEVASGGSAVGAQSRGTWPHLGKLREGTPEVLFKLPSRDEQDEDVQAER